MKTFYSLLTAVACLACGLPVAAQPPDIRQGLVAYWPMDGTPDDIITPDATPFGNHLRLVGMSAGSFVPGRVGNAASFNGTSTYMTNLHSVDNAATGLPIIRSPSRTIMMWVKAPAQSNRYLLGEGNTNTTTPIYILQSGPATNNSKFDVIMRNDGNSTLLNHPQSTNVVFDDTWHHVALVDDRGSQKVYVDGVLDPVSFNYTPAGTFTVNTLTIGSLVRTTVATGNILNGLIDEVALWERALSQAEVQDVYNNGLVTPIPVLPPYLVLEPVNQSIAFGDNAVMTARVIGNRPFDFQWFKDGAPAASGQTLGVFNPVSTYTALNVTANAQFSVSVTNSAGAVSSSNATVTVLPDPPANLTAGIISYWPFDTVDNTLNTTPDVYSHNDMQLVNMTEAQLVPGNTGLSNALSFDGITQYCQRTTGFPLYNNPAYTLSIWVKGDGSAQSDRRIFSEGATNSNTPLVTLGTPGGTGGTSVRPFVRNDANAALLNGPVSARPVFDNTWHHLVWVDSNGVTKLYIDGTLDTANLRYTRSGTFTLHTTSVGAIVRAAVGNQFAGTLDEVATWNRALTFTEVQSIYTNGVPPPVMALPVAITKQPVGRDVYAGERVEFSVETTGTSPIHYQWKKDGADIEDATNSTLLFVSAQVSDAAVYSVCASNEVNLVVSSNATLVVRPLDNITSGLVAYWPLDAVIGATTPDVSPNSNHLSLVNMDSSNLTAGQRGNAMQFNGTDEVAVRYTTNSIGLPLYSNLSYSVSLWVQGAGTQSDRRVFSEGSTTNNTPLLNIGTANDGMVNGADIYIRNNDGGNPVNHRRSALAAFDTTWHHLVWVDNNGTASLYVDGALDSTSFNYVRGVLTPDTISVGGIVRATAGNFFTGLIDDVAVWRRALSAAEVEAVRIYGAVVPEIRITDIDVSEGAVHITFTVPDVNAAYSIKESPDVTQPVDSWPEVGFFVLEGPSGNTYTAHFPQPTGAQRFYKVFKL